MAAQPEGRGEVSRLTRKRTLLLLLLLPLLPLLLLLLPLPLFTATHSSLSMLADAGRRTEHTKGNRRGIHNVSSPSHGVATCNGNCLRDARNKRKAQSKARARRGNEPISAYIGPRAHGAPSHMKK